MPWVTVPEAEVLVQFNAIELAKIRAAALKVGQVDPVGPAITQVVDDVRGYVGASGRYVLGEGETIPSRLMKDTVALIVELIPSRVALPLSKGRKDLADAAREKMNYVRKGEYGLEEPETAAAEQSASNQPSFSGRPRRKARRR